MCEQPFFDDFWEASRLDPVTQPAFGERIAAFDARPPAVHPWARPGRPHPLTRTASPLSALGDARRSRRRFGRDALSAATLGRLLGAVAADARGHRSYPAAGGLYSCGVSVLLLNVAHPLNHRVAQHHAGQHALYDVGPCPSWNELRTALGGGDAATAPAAVLGVFADTGRITAKYGERGGRFVLLEAGALVQQLSLAAAEANVAAYLLGGSADDRLLTLAGHTGTFARFVTALAVGPPAEDGHR